MEMALEFATVSVFADVNQPKGLYVPFSEPDINRAIAHGAIAALWKKDAPVPRYIPTDFPLFMAEDVSFAFTQLVQFYLKNGKQGFGYEDNFYFLRLGIAGQKPSYI